MAKKLTETREIVMETFAPDTQAPQGGPAPFHRHTCANSDGMHIWRCPSPYCRELESVCPDHDGEVPILPGKEHASTQF